MTETTHASAKIRQRKILHLRASGGSTYGYDLLDVSDAVIGHLSSWLGTGKNNGQSRQVYTLRDDSREFTTSAQFLEAYRAKLEQSRRDKEWNAAAHKEDPQ